MMDLKQAADALDVSLNTVRNWVKDGTLKAYRLGPRLLRVMVSDLNALVSPLDNLEAIELEG
jgi:excisionase family DNA binding protein